MTKIQFAKQWKNYNPGDLAGFNEDLACSLVGSGLAVFVDEKNKATQDPVISPEPPGYSLPIHTPSKKTSSLTKPPAKRKG